MSLNLNTRININNTYTFDPTKKIKNQGIFNTYRWVVFLLHSMILVQLDTNKI